MSEPAYRAIAEREQGRARLNSATVTVGVASVAAAGVLTLGLPGPASSSTKTNPGTTTGQQNQGTPSDPGLNPPAYTPSSGDGGTPVSTSGGTHSGF